MLLLVILLSLLLVPNLAAAQMPSAVTAAVHPLEGYSYSAVITPEAIKEIPIEVNPVIVVMNEVRSYADSVSNSIKLLRKLYTEAKQKKFVVPLRFIAGNLKAANDLAKLFYADKHRMVMDLKKKRRLTEKIKEEAKVLRLYAERIELLTLSSEEFYRETTHFVPFEVKVLKD